MQTLFLPLNRVNKKAYPDGKSITYTYDDTKKSYCLGRLSYVVDLSGTSSYYYDIKAEGNKNMNEEWFGIVALSSDPDGGLDIRSPRKAYYVIREFWKNPQSKPNNKKRK